MSIAAAVLLPTMAALCRTQCWRRRPRREEQVVDSKPLLALVTVVCLRAVLPLLLALQVAYKATNGRLVFMLQPCHIMTAALTACVWLVHSHPHASTVLLNAYTHAVYAPWLALLFPGARTAP